MKKLLILAMACLATVASAQSHSVPDNGILTPDKVRGFFVPKLYKVDAQGDVIVCPFGTTHNYPSDTCLNDRRQEVGLVPMAKSIPAGRSFVGFRVFSSPQGDRLIEIYYR